MRIQMLNEMQQELQMAWTGMDELKQQQLLAFAKNPCEFSSAEMAVSIGFRDWCNLLMVDSCAHTSVYEYLKHVNLKTSQYDPVDHPGLIHATHPITDGQFFYSELSEAEQGQLELCFYKVYAFRFIDNLFDVGQIVDGRWKILQQLGGQADGFFNQGVHLVHDTLTEDAEPCVMKVLPSEAMYSGYALREADVLLRLQGHPNIVEYAGSYIPNHRHMAP